jgi:hypothetical protein
MLLLWGKKEDTRARKGDLVKGERPNQKSSKMENVTLEASPEKNTKGDEARRDGNESDEKRKGKVPTTIEIRDNSPH